MFLLVFIVYMQRGTNLPSRRSEGQKWSGQPIQVMMQLKPRNLHVAKNSGYCSLFFPWSSTWRVWISWVFYLFSHFFRHSFHQIWKNNYCFWRILQDFEMFRKGFGWKDDRENIKVFVSCPEQTSFLENVYNLHYSFFKGKGQNILRVSFSLMLLFTLNNNFFAVFELFYDEVKITKCCSKTLSLCWVTYFYPNIKRYYKITQNHG